MVSAMNSNEHLIQLTRQLITEMSLYLHYSGTINTLNIEETVQHHEIQKEY